MAGSLFTKLHRRFGQRLTGSARSRHAHRALAELDARIPAVPEEGLFEAAGAAKHVAVVGAGFGGLSAAYWLARWGFRVTVFEAADRVSGRVHTLNQWVNGRLTEAGGELIGLNHPQWLRFSREFGLGLSVITPEDNYGGWGLEMPLYLNGELVPREQAEALYTEMNAILGTMTPDARKVPAFRPWKARNAAAWDAMSLRQWLDAASPSPLARAAIEATLANNNAEPTDRQSYLANLALVAGGGFDDRKRANFWDLTEVFRCERGNQELAECLRRDVEGRSADNRVETGTPVRRVEIAKKDVRVYVGDETEARMADYVVFALPVAAWDTVEVTPAFPAGMQMNVGPVVKFLSSVRERFWIREALAPSATSDACGEMWEGTDNQMTAGSQGLELTLFAGGDAARAAIAQGDPAVWYREHISQLYPGYAANAIDHQFVNWPADPHIRGGYSCPLPGQVTTIGPFLNKMYRGRLAFAGEHACLAFFGYMEGALESGLRAALRVVSASHTVPAHHVAEFGKAAKAAGV
ncbi:flavin monoamine oxidase family protein [Longimicrobium sp.]|uniref:flavin monoamine oxidase family protein n=1 Tax=Longimicrobium sp. TaxID=2029185 RepID=UPI003B3BB173